jgi:hypothetical protein
LDGSKNTLFVITQTPLFSAIQKTQSGAAKTPFPESKPQNHSYFDEKQPPSAQAHRHPPRFQNGLHRLGVRPDFRCRGAFEHPRTIPSFNHPRNALKYFPFKTVFITTPPTHSPPPRKSHIVNRKSLLLRSVFNLWLNESLPSPLLFHTH